MILDDGKKIHFGQPLEELEKLFGVASADIPMRIARNGIDSKIDGANVSLEFDTGRLRCIRWKEDYQFINPPEPYDHAWKNLGAVDGCCLKDGMSRSDFLAYLAAWERRAQSSGAKKVDFDDMAEGEYCAAIERNEFADMICISMGPTRRAGGGGIWCDGWTIFFSVREPVEKMESVSAFCDAFNTVARPKA
jgi:hypothetical protein